MVSFDICEGNPGALTFLMQAYDVDMFGAERAFQRMQDNGITGCKLYMLWNDFVHEMVHGIFSHLGYCEHDEKKIEELAEALYAVFVDNPDMFREGD